MSSIAHTQFFRGANWRSLSLAHYGFHRSADAGADAVDDAEAPYTPQVTISQFEGLSETATDYTGEDLDTLIDVIMTEHAWLLNELAGR